MNHHPEFRFLCGLAALMALGCLPVCAAVDLQRLPEGGVQPQAVVTADHAVHLVWLGGDPKAAAVFYQRFPMHHVGIYVGNDMMISAPAPGKFVWLVKINWSNVTSLGRPG